MLALIINIAIVIIEIIIILDVKNKTDLVRYYTFLSNMFLAISCMIFIIAFCVGISDSLYVRGFRYIATVGIMFTFLVVIFFLAPKEKGGENIMGDVFIHISGKTGDFAVHYLCPVLSFLSLVFFESGAQLGSEWTAFAAIPSIIYWIIYLAFTFAGRWKEPYGFFASTQNISSASSSKNQTLSKILPLIVVPLSFIALEVIILFAANAG